MLDLRRLRLLRELHERGTIAAVADALQFTPSAVSQQLAMLEREAGVPLLERAGPRRAPDRPGARAGRPRRRAARARRARRGRPRRGRRHGHRPRPHRRLPVGRAASSRCRRWRRCARDAPRLRCELVEAEPEQALPALALGDLDLVLGDEWQHQPRRLPAGLERHELLRRPGAPRAARRTRRRRRDAVPLAELAGEAWTTGHAGHGLGGDDAAHLPRARRLRARHPPPHQRRHGQPRARRPRPGGGAAARASRSRDEHPGVALRPTPVCTDGSCAVTRAADAARPSVQALLARTARVSTLRHALRLFIIGLDPSRRAARRTAPPPRRARTRHAAARSRSRWTTPARRPGTLPLGYAILPATGPKTGTIFFLSGGPGESAVIYTSEIRKELAPLRATHDIVMVDQRGTGRSGAVNCETSRSRRGVREEARAPSARS